MIDQKEVFFFKKIDENVIINCVYTKTIDQECHYLLNKNVIASFKVKKFNFDRYGI